jgi:exodeoxyribonuclease V alpha subunit
MEQLEGAVAGIIFQSADQGFSVFNVQSPGSGKVTAVFKGPAPFLGENIVAQGLWQEHNRFGRQFAVQTYKTVQPSSATGIEHFLGSGAVKGIGKVTAARIVATFGVATLEILAKAPQRLAEVPGIGRKKAADIGAAYAELAGIRELMLFLESQGISANYAARIQAVYGNLALERIKNNPYDLATDIDGIGFQTADKIALGMGFEREAAARLQAGLGFALTTIATNGHTCVPEEELLRLATKLLGVDPGPVERKCDELIKADLLRTVDYGGQTLIYPEYLYRAEVETARSLLFLRDNAASLGKVDTEQIMASWEKEAGIQLAEAQKEAIRVSLRYGVLALTGGPGTGKTTIIKGILAVLKRAGCQVLLAAPTGRAARRLAEAAGQEAKTVHRLLEYNVTGEFGKDEDDPLEANAVIIDEASMLDVVLTYHLLEAIPPGCRLILVGDVDQLPSVGAGSVLKDIIRSGKMPVVRLQEVFRQAEVSPIVRNAHKINQGSLPECEPGSDFSMALYQNEFEAAKFITETYAVANQQDWQQCQVLTPMHRGPCGVENLNKLLQNRMNPAAPTKGEIRVPGGVFRLGDKVMQIRNNYDKDVYNGDIGRIMAISQDQTVQVWYPERQDGQYVAYAQGELADLQLAYAMSVHKSQGSEYPMVILALVPGHYIMLQRNLLYTAVTRAKQKVLLVGTKAALQTAVMNDRTRKRYSLLAERLQEDGEIV